MKFKLGIFAVFILSLLVVLLVWQPESIEQTSVQAIQSEYALIQRECWFDVLEAENIECGELATPSDSGHFRLPFVILRETSARSPEASSDLSTDPLIYLQGGPGGSPGFDREAIDYWLSWRRGAAIERDLILIESRGVGMSQPALTCAAYDTFSLRALRKNLTLEQEMADGYAVLEGCFARLTAAGFDPDHYGTQVSARDLRAFMQLLEEKHSEYQAWNLLGVSYGSRLAMAVASDNPRVRSLILDSVYPAGVGGTQTWPQIFDEAIHRFFAWCELDNHCNQPGKENLLKDLHQTLNHLRNYPEHLTLRRWNGEAPVDLVLNDHRFLSAVFFAIYSHHDWVHLVPAMEGVGGGNRAGLNTLMETFINNALADDFNGLVFMAVDCRDHPVESEEDYRQQLEAYPAFANYMRFFWTYQACHLFSDSNALHMDALHMDALQISPLPTQPALILAGALDPITPVHWAEELHRQWPGSQLKKFDAIGHAVINHKPCVYQALGRFLDNPDRPFEACTSR